MAEEASELTPKQAAFVQEYLIDLNATQAAIRAGYSENTAYSIGSENLKKPEIQEAITEAQKERMRRVQVTQDYVLSTIIEVVNSTKDPVVESFNPQAALKGSELLGKHLGMWTDKTEISGNNGGAVVLQILY